MILKLDVKPEVFNIYLSNYESIQLNAAVNDIMEIAPSHDLKTVHAQLFILKRFELLNWADDLVVLRRKVIWKSNGGYKK